MTFGAYSWYFGHDRPNTMGIPNNPKLYSHPISLVSLLKKFSGSDNSALGILEPIVARLLVCHRGGRPTKAMRHRVERERERERERESW
jgi:hypothetical protein